MTATIPESTAWTPRPAIEFSSQRAVRRHNLGLVLRQVVEHGPRSRATIALDTGLNKATVSRLVSELIDLGLVAECGIEARATVGRPGHMLAVAGEGAVALGLEINVDYLGVRATDLSGRSRYRALETADNRLRSTDAVLDRLAELASGALREVRAQGLRPIGATVALPGLVDVERGALLTAPNLRWSDVAVVDQLRERIEEDLPLDADNEANLAALAELWEGVAVGVSDFMYASGQVGVGGGRRPRGRALPRLSRLRRRVRPHDGGGRRAAVRVRQPRLPGDAVRHRIAARQRGRTARDGGDRPAGGRPRAPRARGRLRGAGRARLSAAAGSGSRSATS